MTLHLTSIQRAGGKTYRIELSPSIGGVAIYDIMECEPGRTPRLMCTSARRADANLIIDALNNIGSKQDE